jgi:hypothetical protein
VREFQFALTEIIIPFVIFISGLMVNPALRQLFQDFDETGVFFHDANGDPDIIGETVGTHETAEKSFDGLRENKTLPPGGVSQLVRRGDSTVPQSTKQDAKGLRPLMMKVHPTFPDTV